MLYTWRCSVGLHWVNPLFLSTKHWSPCYNIVSTVWKPGPTDISLLWSNEEHSERIRFVIETLLKMSLKVVDQEMWYVTCKYICGAATIYVFKWALWYTAPVVYWDHQQYSLDKETNNAIRSSKHLGKHRRLPIKMKIIICIGRIYKFSMRWIL